jgi:dihydroflavonol-4-reductase
MKILLTGGHGFIGSNVVKQLLESGHEVRCLVRKSSDTSRLDGLVWEPFVGDVRAADLMTAAAQGCDAIIHLASPSSWNDIDSPYMKQIVEDGTRNVLEAAKAHGGLPVVYCSSVIAVNGTITPEVQNEDSPFTLNDPSLVYAMSKNAAEKICEEYAGVVPVMTVCPAEVYGPFDTGMVTAGNLIDFAKSNPVLVTRGGTSVAHVEDVARGVVAALERGKPGARYILGGENLSVEELAQLVLDIVGKKSKVLALPTPFIELFTKVAVKIRMPLPYNPLVVPYATKYWFVDNNRAKSELGVEFRSARETLEPTIAWLKEAGHI